MIAIDSLAVADGPDDQPLVAFGTSLGLYIAVRHDPATLRQVLQIPVSYCAVLRDFGIFMIQSDGRLYAYLVDSLIMSSSPDPKSQAPPQQVSGQKDVLFFRVGKVGPRTLAVYAKRDGVNSTVLKAMEPITATERARAQHSRFLGMGGKKTDWFRQYKVSCWCYVRDNSSRSMTGRNCPDRCVRFVIHA